VEQGNGTPSLFATLSCAEYHCKDIEKLLNDRRNIAGDPPVSLSSVTEKVRAVYDYSIIIEEYFQARVSKTMTRKYLGFIIIMTGSN
jgi:hypothetical protein